MSANKMSERKEKEKDADLMVQICKLIVNYKVFWTNDGERGGE